MIAKLTIRELSQMGCEMTGCHHDHNLVYFHGQCHPRSPVWAAYEKATGTLIIRCARCDEFIARIGVAE